MSQSSKRNIYLLIIFLLLLINVVGAYFLIRGNQTNTEQAEEIVQLEQDYTATMADLKAQKEELAAMKGQNATLDSVIAVREQEIEKIQKDIELLLQKNQLTASELAQARELIKQLQMENATYAFKVDSLNRVTDSLEATTAELGDSLMTEKERTALLEEDKAYLTDKYEKGKLLQAADLYASGIILKERRGTEKETTKLRKVEEVKICFETGQNLVRDPGPVALYVRITDPKGETLYLPAQGSGTFTDAEGNDVRYTKEASFDYTGESKSVCVYWGAGITLEGTYEVAVYQDGYVLGETSFVLD